MGGVCICQLTTTGCPIPPITISLQHTSRNSFQSGEGIISSIGKGRKKRSFPPHHQRQVTRGPQFSGTDDLLRNIFQKSSSQSANPNIEAITRAQPPAIQVCTSGQELTAVQPRPRQFCVALHVTFLKSPFPDLR